MTKFDRGDIILISYPVNDDLEMHLRPAMVVQTAHPSDSGIAVVPIGAEASAEYRAIRLLPGSFEAARCGLIGLGYLIACEEIVVDRQFVMRKLGRCPWQTLGEFMEMRRQPIARTRQTKEPERIPATPGLVREAV